MSGSIEIVGYVGGQWNLAKSPVLYQSFSKGKMISYEDSLKSYMVYIYTIHHPTWSSTVGLIQNLSMHSLLSFLSKCRVHRQALVSAPSFSSLAVTQTLIILSGGATLKTLLLLLLENVKRHWT